jgi:hypothetical protein
VTKRFWDSTVPRRQFLVPVILSAFLVVGCAPNRSRPLPPFETLAVESAARPVDGLEARSDSDAAKAGANAGAKGGAAAGAATSLLCGPFVFFCLPFFAATGAVVGVTTGGLAGALNDAVENLPGDQASRARAILADIDSRRDLFAELRDGVAAAVPPARTAGLESAEAVIYVGIEKLEFVQDDRSELGLRLTALLVAEWNRDKRTPRTEKRRYVYETILMPAEYWLQDDGATMDAGFTECIEKVVQAIDWDLSHTTGGAGLATAEGSG